MQKYKEQKGLFGSEKVPVPYETMDEPTTELDFTKTPPLQNAYMSNGQHNIGSAITKLSKSVKGFWVEMPIMWADGLTVTPIAPANSPQTIALNSVDIVRA